jgi:hypothetical protein
MLHQARKRGPRTVEVHLLDPARLRGVNAEKTLDIGGHPLVDQLEEPASRGIKAIVEIEDPIADVGETGVHVRATA